MRFRPHVTGLLIALLASLSLHGASFAVSLRSCTGSAEGRGQGPDSALPGIVESDLDIDGLEPASTATTEAPPAAPEPPRTAPPPPISPARPVPPPPPIAHDDDSPPPPEPDTPGASAELPPLPVPTPVPLPLPTESGGGPNSLGAQRSRLGGGATCEDPVAGVWKSSIYDGVRGQWYVFTLTMQRDGEQLSGTIQSKFWAGSRHASRMPSSCAETSLFAQVSMPATGTVEGARVRFGARRVVVDQVFCGTTIHYSPDRFSGHVDVEAHEFQSIVTDGLNLVDQPMLFRRVSCLR